MRFEFTKKWKDEVYVYSSEELTLYVRNGDWVDKRTMTTKQALKLLTDIVYGTVKPLSNYFEYGRDSLGSCPRCGHREV